MPTTYSELYFPVLVQIVFAAAVAAGLIFAGLFFGKRNRNAAKDSPYESGVKPVGNARERFSVKFYLVAMLFILFDIEAVFLYPWAVVYRELGMAGFIEMVLFMVLVLSGFYFIWKKGALDWTVTPQRKAKDH